MDYTLKIILNFKGTLYLEKDYDLKNSKVRNDRK